MCGISIKCVRHESRKYRLKISVRKKKCLGSNMTSWQVWTGNHSLLSCMKEIFFCCENHKFLHFVTWHTKKQFGKNQKKRNVWISENEYISEQFAFFFLSEILWSIIMLHITSVAYMYVRPLYRVYILGSYRMKIEHLPPMVCPNHWYWF